MDLQQFKFEYRIYHSVNDLNEADAQLLKEARKATDLAYAPYSNFQVGAAAILKNGEIVRGSNQENASFPVGLCAERVLLSAIASLFSVVPIETLAISYYNKNGESNRPISPCGICRQSLLEYEERVQHPIRLILAGLEGEVYVLPSISVLLPLSFTSSDLK